MFGRKKQASTLEFLGAAMIGAGAGFLLGMLFAPKTGKELRQDVYDKTKFVVDGAKDLGQSLKNMIQSDQEDIFYYDDEDKLVFSKNFMEEDEKDIEDEK